MIQLKANDPRDVKQYISRSNKYFKNNNCLQKIKELHSILVDKFTIKQQQAYDKLLCVITVTRQKVKNNLKHAYRRKVE